MPGNLSGGQILLADRACDSDALRTVLASRGAFANIKPAAIGAAMTGLRPIVDLSYSSFLYMAMDQLVNQAAKNRYMFGGQSSIPIVFRSAMFYGLNTGAHHSDRPYPMFMNVPGLKIIVPASASDAKGLLRSAVDSNDPVLIFETCLLWGQKEEVDENEYRIPLGVVRVRRQGNDVTVVGISGSVPLALKAADQLATEGISAEVIDPRTLVPLDTKTIIESVRRTGRLVIAEPAARTCGAAAEISAIVAEQAFDALRAPILRVTAPNMGHGNKRGHDRRMEDEGRGQGHRGQHRDESADRTRHHRDLMVANVCPLMGARSLGC